jgi:hypothetical protein
VWRVVKANGHYSVQAEGMAIAGIVTGQSVGEEEQGNAHLIAAAPVLLAACKQAKELLENSLLVTPEGFRIDDRPLRDALLDAILRAEGYRVK